MFGINRGMLFRLKQGNSRFHSQPTLRRVVDPTLLSKEYLGRSIDLFEVVGATLGNNYN